MKGHKEWLKKFLRSPRVRSMDRFLKEIAMGEKEKPRVLYVRRTTTH
jgi:hypothetical protein